MDSYTIDSVVVLRYAAGALPKTVQNILSRAGSGAAELQVPGIVVAESMYMAAANESIKGTAISMDAGDVIDVIRRRMNAKVVDVTRAELQRLPSLIATWPAQMHDAMVVASHQEQNTDAIVTTDSKMATSYPTVWN